MTRKKLISRLIKRFIPITIVTILYWPVTAIYFVSSVYDVMRQKNKNKQFIFKQYFLVNGALTWILSPLNMLIDIICLPFINKQVYKLEQLPRKHQEEIKDILENCPNKLISNYLNEAKSTSKRTMLFYKWYGVNIDNTYPCQLFHKKFKHVLTIGVSNFKPKSETSQHFGWFRAGIRVLINIDEAVDNQAYLDVNNQRHVWKTDGPLFIFDDTVLHQSFNLSDKSRNCLFIDVTRPSLIPFFINSMVKTLGYISINLPGFSNLSNWKVVK